MSEEKPKRPRPERLAKVTVFLPRDLRDFLTSRSRGLAWSRSALVRQLLANDRLRIRATGAALGARTDEDLDRAMCACGAVGKHYCPRHSASMDSHPY